MKLARRVLDLPPYVFATVERRIAQQRAKGVDVISFGVDSPDLPPPQFISHALYASASRPATQARWTEDADASPPSKREASCSRCPRSRSKPGRAVSSPPAARPGPATTRRPSPVTSWTSTM